MNKVFAIAQKELASYFRSPIAYIILVIMVSVFNVFFFMIISESREASLKDVFQVMEFMFLFFVPLLTMRTFAEEKKNGTMEFLMTTPTSNLSLVVGKYLGNLSFFSLIVLLSFIYYLVLEIFANPDRGTIFLGYFGIWLEGAMFVAIGVLASAWSKNQIVAAMTAYAILLTAYFAIAATTYVEGPLQSIFEFINMSGHLAHFSSGFFSISSCVYFISVTIVALVFTRLIIENRLWR
jgi:ABC-2 type transport system permease protein